MCVLQSKLNITWLEMSTIFHQRDIVLINDYKVMKVKKNYMKKFNWLVSGGKPVLPVVTCFNGWCFFFFFLCLFNDSFIMHWVRPCSYCLTKTQIIEVTNHLMSWDRRCWGMTVSIYVVLIWPVQSTALHYLCLVPTASKRLLRRCNML